MLSLFRNQQPFSLLILLSILVVSRLPYFSLDHLSPAETYIDFSLANQSLSVFLAMVLTFGQAIWINTIFTNGQFMDERTVVPALVWILLTSLDNGFVVVGFPLLSVVLLLAILHILVSVQSNVIPRRQCFHLGVLFGILVILHPPFVIVTPLMIAVIYNMNTLGVREYLIFLLGVVTTLFWAWSFAYVTDLSLHWVDRLVQHTGLPIHRIGWYEGAIWIIVALYCIAGFAGLFSLMRVASSKRKRNIRTLILFSLGIMLTFLISTDWDFSNILMLLLPLSFLISIALLIIHKIKIAEAVFGIFVLTILSSIVLRLLNFF